MTRLGFSEGDAVCISTVSNDDVTREVDGMHVHAFDIPLGCHPWATTRNAIA